MVKLTRNLPVKLEEVMVFNTSLYFTDWEVVKSLLPTSQNKMGEVSLFRRFPLVTASGAGPSVVHLNPRSAKVTLVSLGPGVRISLSPTVTHR